MKLASYVIPSDDIEASTAFFRSAFGVDPEIETPYYVQFDTGVGVPLGLDPNAQAKGVSTAVPYFAVDNVDAQFAKLIAAGATAIQEPSDVGGGARTAVVLDTGSNAIGVINQGA